MVVGSMLANVSECCVAECEQFAVQNPQDLERNAILVLFPHLDRDRLSFLVQRRSSLLFQVLSNSSILGHGTCRHQKVSY
jgi:hypothetical protein